MIDFDKISEHQFACYVIGEAVINGKSGHNYKGKFYSVFYHKEYNEFSVNYFHSERGGFQESDDYRTDSVIDAYDYLQEILLRST